MTSSRSEVLWLCTLWMIIPCHSVATVLKTFFHFSLYSCNVTISDRHQRLPVVRLHVLFSSPHFTDEGSQVCLNENEVQLMSVYHGNRYQGSLWSNRLGPTEQTKSTERCSTYTYKHTHTHTPLQYYWVTTG